MTIMADIMGNAKDKQKFTDILNKGKESYERKLWNGVYYNFDCSENEKKVYYGRSVVRPMVFKMLRSKRLSSKNKIRLKFNQL